MQPTVLCATARIYQLRFNLLSGGPELTG
jgi:hypothetical protein